MKGTSRIKILSAAYSGLLLVPLATATPAAVVELVTPYPAVAAEPGLGHLLRAPLLGHLLQAPLQCTP
jgi:hypothetical protein